MNDDKKHHPTRRMRRGVAVIIAGATLGVAGTLAVASAQATSDSPSPLSCGTAVADLEQAAEAARRLELQAPELFDRSPRPADEHDLRLAAEWAYRTSVASPVEGC